MDVFCEKTQHYVQTTGIPRTELQPVFHAWNTAYNQARAALLAHLSQRDYVQVKERFAAHLRAAPPPRPVTEATLRPSRVKDIAPILIYRRLAAMRAYTAWLPPAVPPSTASLTRYHQLRIATKYLRYTLEFFQHALPAETENAIHALKKLQTHLGDLQDAIVTCERLHTIQHHGQWQTSDAPTPSPVLPIPGLERYYAYKQDEIQHLLATFPKLWHDYQSADFSELMARVAGGGYAL